MCPGRGRRRIRNSKTSRRPLRLVTCPRTWTSTLLGRFRKCPPRSACPSSELCGCICPAVGGLLYYLFPSRNRGLAGKISGLRNESVMTMYVLRIQGSLRVLIVGVSPCRHHFLCNDSNPNFGADTDVPDLQRGCSGHAFLFFLLFSFFCPVFFLSISFSIGLLDVDKIKYTQSLMHWTCDR